MTLDNNESSACLLRDTIDQARLGLALRVLLREHHSPGQKPAARQALPRVWQMTSCAVGGGGSLSCVKVVLPLPCLIGAARHSPTKHLLIQSCSDSRLKSARQCVG